MPLTKTEFGQLRSAIECMEGVNLAGSYCVSGRHVLQQNVLALVSRHAEEFAEEQGEARPPTVIQVNIDGNLLAQYLVKEDDGETTIAYSADCDGKFEPERDAFGLRRPVDQPETLHQRSGCACHWNGDEVVELCGAHVQFVRERDAVLAADKSDTRADRR